jgi:hypothetical protein
MFRQLIDIGVSKPPKQKRLRASTARSLEGQIRVSGELPRSAVQVEVDFGDDKGTRVYPISSFNF